MLMSRFDDDKSPLSAGLRQIRKSSLYGRDVLTGRKWRMYPESMFAQIAQRLVNEDGV